MGAPILETAEPVSVESEDKTDGGRGRAHDHFDGRCLRRTQHLRSLCGIRGMWISVPGNSEYGFREMVKSDSGGMWNANRGSPGIGIHIPE